jgi:uncharacterized protein
MEGRMAKKIAVVTGGHAYEVQPFHELFRSLPGIDAYIQHLDDFASSTEAVRDSYAGVVFYNMPIETPADEGLPWYCGKPKTALEHLGSTAQGIVLLHHALVAYPSWSVWNDIAGSSGRINSSYHLAQQFQVEIAAPDHPIVQGLAAWRIVDETYAIPGFKPDGQALLTTQYIPSWPVIAWARMYRKARVFCYQSGHDQLTYKNPGFRLVLANGIHWTAGR